MKNKDIFQKIVIGSIVVYILYFAYSFLNIIYSLEILDSLKAISKYEIQSTVTVISIIFNIISLIAFPFGIYIIHTVGQNKRELQKIRSALIKSEIIKSKPKENHDKKQKKCEICGAKISVNDIVCPHCLEILEEDNELLENMIEDHKAKEISFCNQCGFQLFEEDKICPNCGKAKVDKQN